MNGRRFYFLLHTLFCLKVSSRWMADISFLCCETRIMLAILCERQTFPFYIAHTLPFEFLTSVHHKLYFTERRYSLCKTKIMLAFSMSVRAFPQNAQVWFTWLICAIKVYLFCNRYTVQMADVCIFFNTRSSVYLAPFSAAQTLQHRAPVRPL